MSIIYDALKRVEVKEKGTGGNLSSHPGPKRNKPGLLQLIYLLCILIVFGFLVIFAVNSFMGKPLLGKPSKSSAQKPALYLTGIFFSDGRYMALINDRAVKIGDLIEGHGEIYKIDSSGVDIRFKDESFRLNYP